MSHLPNSMPSVTSIDSGDESRASSICSLYYEAQEEDDEQINASMTPEEEKRQQRLNSKRLFVRWRQRAGDFVNNTAVQFIVIGLIIINALMMAVATFDFVTDDPNVSKIFETIDLIFLSIFSFELALQFMYRGLTLFQDGWLVFDFVIIVLSWSFNGIQVIRSFRVFRVFRLVTRVKVLRDLVTAIMVVLPRMTAIGALLMLIFYVFSVLFVELFGELELSGNYFNTLDASLFTCFQMMTMEWADLARECQETLSYAPILFVCFIMITGFIVFNLIIAVVCDALAVAEEMAREIDGDAEEIPEEKLFQAQERVQKLSNQITGLVDRQKDLDDLLELLGIEIRLLEESK